MIELLETIGPLTDPTAHAGTPDDAFHLVLPSIPGYGFSGEPTGLGWDADRIARAWAELMDRLGYTRYVAQGGDVGAYIADWMGRQAPEGLLGIHLNVLTAAVGLKDQLPAESEQERAAHDALNTFLTDGFAIVLEQSTRPQTIGYALLDSPVALAAWMLDHDTDSYYKFFRAFVDGQPVAISPGQHRRRHHAVLADGHRRLGRSVVLGVRTGRSRCGRAGSAAGLGSGRLHELPRRGLPCPAQLGRGCFPRRRLLQRGRHGRSLRRLGGAQAFDRGAGCVPLAAIAKEEVMSTAVDTTTDIRTSRIDFADEQIDDLRRRIAATRWPSKELVARSVAGRAARYDQGARAVLGGGLRLRANRGEAQAVASVHDRDRRARDPLHPRAFRAENAMPLIMTHGWPGSVIELLETIGPLTDPTAHAGTPDDAFHLVLPSVPGYGFSGEPTEVGWGPGRVARAWAELMQRLGYTRYVAQGGDVGAVITDEMGRQAPEGLLGIHLNVLIAGLEDLPAESEQERAAHDALNTFFTDGIGYFLEQTTGETIGYALLDSPVALAAWMLDHDTDGYYKISRAFVDGEPVGNLTGTTSSTTSRCTG